MYEFDDYVVISHDDLPRHERSAPGESCQEQQYRTKAPEQLPRPYTRAYIDLVHTIQDEWTAFEAVNHRSSTFRHSSLHSIGYLGELSTYVDSIADALWPVNKTIHDNPELGFKEYIAHRTLTEFMQSQENWKVQCSAYEMSTAWIAVYDSGKKGPVVSFNAEMGTLKLKQSHLLSCRWEAR